MFRSTIGRRRLAASLYLGLVALLAPRALLATVDVSVEGVTGAVRDNVLASLSLYLERERADISAARVRRLHQNAVEEIRTALRPFGYYRPRIDAMLRETPEGWSARYDIEPGPPVLITTVAVNLTGAGADELGFRALADQFPIARGDPLNHALYEQAKQRFETLASERGYFDLRFTRREIRLDLEAYEAGIYLDVDTGPRYRFGEIIIDQDLLEPELLRRYVRLEPGEPYTTAALLDLQNALSSSNYFADVQVEADPREAKDHAIPVHVRLTPRKRDKYTFGVGYGTDTGARGQIGWERFYLNRQGHHTRVELRGSGIEKSVSAGYFIPIRNPRTDQLAFTGGYEELDTRTFEAKTRRLAVGRTTVRGRTYETLSLTHLREDFIIGSQTGLSTLLLPGVSWTYYWGEDRIYTRRGARVLLDLRGASENVASDTALFQARLQTKLILPISSFGRLLGRIEVGSTRIDNFNELPASLRFFAGGDVSVRGYAYNTLGPTDSTGDVIGGRRLLVGSIEYEQHITGSWAVAVFYDAGNALNEFSDPLKEGAGIGVRWRSPIGQIRLDAARALSDPGEPWRIHLYIGPDL